MSDKALIAARAAFNKSHASVSMALDHAIAVYMETKKGELYIRGRELEVQIADTDAGEGTAVVIIGFSNPQEAQAFVLELTSEKCV